MVFRVKFPCGVEPQSGTTLVSFPVVCRLFLRNAVASLTCNRLIAVLPLNRIRTNLERNPLLLLNPCCVRRNGCVSFQGYLCVSQRKPRLEYELVTDNHRFCANTYYGTRTSHFIYKQQYTDILYDLEKLCSCDFVHRNTQL